MNKSRFLATKILVVVMALFIAGGCSQKPEDLILGKWKSENSAWEFLKDGTFNSASRRIQGPPFLLNGKWNMHGDNKIKLSYLSNGKEQPTTILNISFPDNDTLATKLVTPENANYPSFIYTRASAFPSFTYTKANALN